MRQEEGAMAMTLARVGRPSSVALAQRQREERQHLALLLPQALQHLNHPSRLSDSPLCELEGVRLRARGLQGYRFPRAHVVFEAVRRSYEEAWQELGDTADAPTWWPSPTRCRASRAPRPRSGRV
jgi:hypothetical protein